MKSRQQHSLSMLAFLLFMGVGTYNAIVINSESQIGNDIRFVKRLDELYGVTKPGRLVAASKDWKKLPAPQKVEVAKVQREIIQEVKTTQAAVETSASQEAVAAVQEELSLSLTEVVNPKKWEQGLQNTQFSGSLTTNNGTIETLEVSLPNGEGVSVSFSEMSGNVFQYDLNGEIYTGMMYQVDRNAFMITLTNGPLEGTRMKFLGEPSRDQAYENQVAEASIMGTNNESDNYGQPTDEEFNKRYEQPVVQAEVAPIPPEVNPYYGQPAYTEEQAYNMDVQFQQQAMDYNPNQGV
jgi:hypothetical protein